MEPEELTSVVTLRCLASEQLHNIMETPLHPQKCTLWNTLSTSGNVGSIFFSDTVTADHYLHVLCFPEWFGYGWSWPPYSPDLNPCNYFLWGFQKDAVYKNRPHRFEELQPEIWAGVISTSEETLAAVVRNVRCPMSDADGLRHRWCIYWKCFYVIVNLPRLPNSETPNTVKFAM
jgi:hypothetical protein